jgi:hypothetical protein
MTMIEDARRFWTFYSTHAYLLTMAVGGGLAWLAKEHPELYSQIPGWGLSLIGVALAFTFGVSRVVKQVRGCDDAAQ